jgi:alkylation response protein AidB-like acyl-CoA dehydrogenase
MTSGIEDLLANCDELARRFAARADRHDREGSFPFENVRELREAGLPALTVPRDFDGMGVTLLEMAQVLQHLARGDGSTALGLAMHVHIIGQLAESGAWQADGRADAFERLCRESVASGALMNSAASEPEMGSPSRGGLPATMAKPVEGGFIINGRKRWVTFAPALRYFLTSATVTDRQKGNGDADGDAPAVGVFAVASDAPGVELINTWGDSLSLRASGSDDVVFHDVFVPAVWQVEARQPGKWRGTLLPPAWSACAFSAVYLGIAEAAQMAFADYARRRVPTTLGKPIAELPNIRRAVGQMDVTLRAARAVLDDTATRWQREPDQRAGMASAVAAVKYMCTNMAITVTELALRAAGANGLDRQLPLERLFRDARAGLLHPPQDDLALELMGKEVLSSEFQFPGT